MSPITTPTSTATPTTSRGPVSRWAGDVAGPSPEATASQDAPGSGVRGLAAAMVAGPIAMTAWFLVEPAVLPREEPAVFLASVAAAPGRYLLATAFLTLAGALAIPAALGVGRLLRPRMPRLAALLVVTMSLSGLGLWAQAGFRSFVASMVLDGTVPASAVESYTAFQQNGLFAALVVPAVALGAVSTVVWIGALVRTRLAPLWVPAALLVGTVLASGEFPDVVTIGGAALSAGANVALARILIRSARG
jgi:hypothetical protein